MTDSTSRQPLTNAMRSLKRAIEVGISQRIGMRGDLAALKPGGGARFYHSTAL
jgi:hypothetical protein